MKPPVAVYIGDCLDVLAAMPDNFAHAVVTDPPYGITMSGEKWDAYSASEYREWCERWCSQVLRVLRPGGHFLSFGATRTWHRIVCAAEDVGFEIRDSLAWLYGSGFPKSLDIGKEMDRVQSAERERIGSYNGASNIGRLDAGKRGYNPGDNANPGIDRSVGITAPATDLARRWDGWGTALKPAFEPVMVARKPVTGALVWNVLEHGTGAINIDGSRIAGSVKGYAVRYPSTEPGATYAGAMGRGGSAVLRDDGRWPSNVLADEPMAAVLDWQQDGAARFFYTAKVSPAERAHLTRNATGAGHPTMKPLAVMTWLVGLVVPAGGLVIDPFAGTGTTLQAARVRGCGGIGIEREAQYLPMIRARFEDAKPPLEVYE